MAAIVWSDDLFILWNTSSSQSYSNMVSINFRAHLFLIMCSVVETFKNPSSWLVATTLFWNQMVVIEPVLTWSAKVYVVSSGSNSMVCWSEWTRPSPSRGGEWLLLQELVSAARVKHQRLVNAFTTINAFRIQVSISIDQSQVFSLKLGQFSWRLARSTGYHVHVFGSLQCCTTIIVWIGFPCLGHRTIRQTGSWCWTNLWDRSSLCFSMRLMPLRISSRLHL
jgi:hypothetical protein